MKNNRKSSTKPVSRRINYDPQIQKPFADYFNASNIATSQMEAEFDIAYSKDNSFLKKDYIIHLIKKYKIAIMLGLSAVIILVIVLAIII